ncbi:hypothetical protein JL720_11539 [Aureococcus anophagefferens]|nr:hypothetical protein JL720_11539 [Aureococcus anophagefferens]
MSDMVMGQGPFDMKYFLSGALAGGICCSITHGGLVPVDVVKTKIQLQPDGYFIQGWFKFGGVEFFKINITRKVGEETAWNNKTPIYLLSSAMAEFIADIFLCPYEACRIRLVSDPSYADGFVPILFKQIPYTMAKFAVQGKAADSIYGALGASPDQPPAIGNLGVSLASGVVAGVAAAIISHPADTLLSKINKGGAGGDGSMFQRMGNIVARRAS